MASNLLKTYRESNAASNAELARNFPSPAPTTPKTKAQIIADAGLSIAQPQGISTLGTNVTTPFVPPVTTGSLPQPAARNIWQTTAAHAGQPLAPAAAAPVLEMLPSHGIPGVAAPDLKAAPAPVIPGVGSFMVAGGKRVDASGKATGGFADTGPAEVARVSAREAFSKERDKEDKIAGMRKDATQMAAFQAQGLSGKDVFDASFVGKADASNPSFRNAVLAQRNIDAQSTGQAQQLATLNSQIADATKAQPVGGQMYNQQELAGEQARATIDKTLASANLDQATAAAGGKGHSKGNTDSAVDDIAKLAPLSTADIAIKTNARAAINKGGTGETFTIPDEKGNPQTVLGVVTPDQKAAFDTDIASLETLNARRKRPLDWNWVTGNKDKYNSEATKLRQRLSRVAAPIGVATK